MMGSQRGRAVAIAVGSIDVPAREPKDIFFMDYEEDKGGYLYVRL